MFSPRGTLPPRPRGPNPAGATPQGAFRGGGVGGLQRNLAPTPQGTPSPRFSGQETLQWTGSQRINVRVTLHRPDPRKVKEKSNLHQEQKGEPRAAPHWESNPCSTGTAGQKLPGSEQTSNTQNRYMPESASSILASFGLSNEDLEELSRYPDDQLTPENMPLILREIRMRKLGHSLPALPAPSRGEEPLGGAQVKGKVIDYGHASKYGYTEDPLEVRAYNPNGMSEEPAESRAYKPETPGADSREDFSREQSLVLSFPPSAVPCNPGFEDLIKPTMFQSDSSNPRPFFLASNTAAKVPALCAAPAGLPAVKPVSQPALPPVMPPMMPPPLMPPVMLPLVQLSMPQHLLLPMPQPPFPTDLAATNQHERPQHEATTSQASSQSSSGHQPFLTQAEEPFRSPFGVVKASWLPVFPQSDAQKAKRLPTPSMMNDYYATSPRIFPHMCSLCNIECTHMKDWILHQNTPSHIESCRQLRQQYPEWNPEAHSSKRNDGDRKENQTPRRRSSSGSPSPRRSRRSSSGYVHRRSRSRSRSPGRFRPTRPRSRSPRRLRRFSPRHRSRSPYRSRYPLRTSLRPLRSSSHDWAARTLTRSQDRKSTLEAMVKSLGPGCAADFNKHKSSTHGSSGSGSSRGSSKKSPGSTKKLVKTSVSSKASKSDGPELSSSPDGDDGPQEKETEQAEQELSAGASGSHTPPYNRLLRKELLSCGTVLRISDLPDDGFTDQDIKKIVQPFGKVSDLIVLRSRNEAFLEMNYKEAVIAAVKYGEMVPVMVNRKRVKISIAEKPKASPSQPKTGIKKKTQTVKKAASSTKKDQTGTSKKTKSVTGKKEKTKESTTGSPKIKKTANTAAKSTDKDLQISAETEIGTEETNPLEPKDSAEGDRDTEPVMEIETPSSAGVAPALEEPVQTPPEVMLDVVEVKETLVDQEATVTTTKSEETPEPASKEPDETCVVLISNLPEKGCSLEEVSNLAKPFGGMKDVLVLSSHKKAYLEISKKSADSMVRFYTCFPMTLDGHQLCIDMVPQQKTVTDEESIFIALIKESDPKVNTETIHSQFVHLGNLPDDGYRELEAVCVGLRFGKVVNYVVLKNKNKAILQLDSTKAAQSMHSFLKQYPYNMGEHTLTCALSPSVDSAEAEVVKKEVQQDEGSQGSAGLKKYPEGSGVVQTAAANRLVDPSVSKKGAIPVPCGKDKMSAGHIEPSESHLGKEVRELAARPAQMSAEKVDTGLEGTVMSVMESADSKLSEEMLPLPSGMEREEAVQDHPEPMLVESAVGSFSEKGIKEEELPASATQPTEEVAHVGGSEDAPTDHVMKLAVGDSMGVLCKVLPPDPGAAPVEMVLSGVAQPSNQLDAPEKNPLSEAVKTKCEMAATSVMEKETGSAVENKLNVAGEMKPEELVLKVRRALEENPEKLLVRTGAATEKKLERSVAKVEAAVENTVSAVSESNEGGSTKAHPNKGTESAKADETPRAVALNPSLPVKESPSVGKTMLKAVVSLLDISRVPAWRTEPALCRIGEQKPPSKPETRDQTMMEKKLTSKEEASLQPGSSPPSPGDGSCQGQGSRSGGSDGKGGNGRNSSPQEKDWQMETRASSKQAQEGESRAPNAKKDTSSTKAPGGGRASKSGTSSTNRKEEEELFPFNLDEFVTVDEVVEEVESPVKMRRNPPRGKRKEGAKANSEPSSKRRKGKSSVAHAAESEPSFLTLDEIGDDEEATAQLMGVAGLEALSDPQGLVVVDEVTEEEEAPSELVKDLQSLLPSNSQCKQEDLESHKDISRLGFEEQDLKAEPLVTVDEIGEVEELPLNEPADLNIKNGLKCKEDQEKAAAEDPGDGASSQVPDDPSALVTVDEIQEDNEDNPLVTLDEVNEDEDDFLADFSRLKEDLNFVTVDEVGEEDEEEENSCPEKTVTQNEDDKDIVALAGPEETEILGDLSPGEETAEAPKAKGDEPGSGDKEPESQQKKAAPSGVSKPQTTPKDLDYLIPKAGFFCQICSLFYADETSVKNHCKTLLHQQNMMKFMAQQQKDEVAGGEEQNTS